MTNNDKANELYFSGLSATAIATNGMFTNDDLKLEAPLLRASGVGTLIDQHKHHGLYFQNNIRRNARGIWRQITEELTGLRRLC